MRIIDEIPHTRYKITVFLHEEKYTIKFEDGLFEQNYKLQKSGAFAENESIKKLVNETFMEGVEKAFEIMYKTLGEGQRQLSSDDDIVFDDII